MSMSKNTIQELEHQAESIMAGFNFEKVQKHMQDTNHQWYKGGGQMEVPDVMDLRVTARDLLTKAIHAEDECTNIGTGGLVAYKMPLNRLFTPVSAKIRAISSSLPELDFIIAATAVALTLLSTSGSSPD